jgi:hypothetical protein
MVLMDLLALLAAVPPLLLFVCNLESRVMRLLLLLLLVVVEEMVVVVVRPGPQMHQVTTQKA